MKLKLSLLLIGFFCFGNLIAQEELTEPAVESTQDTIKIRDTYTSPVINDDMTIDPDQNKKWMKGLHKFPAKPKNAWELGLHGGHYFINGDVDERLPFAGIGLGLHLRKAIHYTFSVRFNLFYGQTYGVDPQQ